jgi:hypothetical protein
MAKNFAICDDCWMAYTPNGPVRMREPVQEYCGWCGQKTYSGIYRRAEKADVPFNLTAVEARAYIMYFRNNVLPGTDFVDTSNKRRIRLDRMTDADAIFVATQFRQMETEAAARTRAWLGHQGRN